MTPALLPRLKGLARQTRTHHLVKCRVFLAVGIILDVEVRRRIFSIAPRPFHPPPNGLGTQKFIHVTKRNHGLLCIKKKCFVKGACKRCRSQRLYVVAKEATAQRQEGTVILDVAKIGLVRKSSPTKLCNVSSLEQERDGVVVASSSESLEATRRIRSEPYDLG